MKKLGLLFAAATLAVSASAQTVAESKTSTTFTSVLMVALLLRRLATSG